MLDGKFSVLFLCTGNTARSILAECILRHLGEGRFVAYSAGSLPKGVVNPFALKVLQAHGISTTGVRSKSWRELAGSDAPKMDFVVTVCDSAEGEAWPLWPGQPVTAHWGIEGSDIDKERAFEQAFRFLKERISALVALPIESLDRAVLGQAVGRIGCMEGATQASIKD